MAVDERGENAMPDEICRLCKGKQQRRRDGRSVQLPGWVMNKIKSSILLLLPQATKMKTLSKGESLNVIQKVSLFFVRLFRIRGPIPNWEGEREGGKEGRY